MGFEDYKELDSRPEEASKEEIKELAKKYGVSDFFRERPKFLSDIQPRIRTNKSSKWLLRETQKISVLCFSLLLTKTMI